MKVPFLLEMALVIDKFYHLPTANRLERRLGPCHFLGMAPDYDPNTSAGRERNMQTGGRAVTRSVGSLLADPYRASTAPSPRGSGPASCSLDRGIVNDTWMGQSQAQRNNKGANGVGTTAIDASDDCMSPLDEMPVAFRIATAAGLVRLSPSANTSPRSRDATYERQLVGGLARTLARGRSKNFFPVFSEERAEAATGQTAL